MSATHPELVETANSVKFFKFEKNCSSHLSIAISEDA